MGEGDCRTERTKPCSCGRDSTVWASVWASWASGPALGAGCLLAPALCSTVMNLKLKGQWNLFASISLIQYNLFFNSFSHAKALQNDSQQITAASCKFGQLISSPFVAVRAAPLAGRQLGKLIICRRGNCILLRRTGSRDRVNTGNNRHRQSQRGGCGVRGRNQW